MHAYTLYLLYRYNIPIIQTDLIYDTFSSVHKYKIAVKGLGRKMHVWPGGLDPTVADKFIDCTDSS